MGRGVLVQPILIPKKVAYTNFFQEFFHVHEMICFPLTGDNTDNSERHYISHLHFWHHSEWWSGDLVIGATEKMVTLWEFIVCHDYLNHEGEHPKLYSVGTIVTIGWFNICECTCANETLRDVELKTLTEPAKLYSVGTMVTLGWLLSTQSSQLPRQSERNKIPWFRLLVLKGPPGSGKVPEGRGCTKNVVIIFLLFLVWFGGSVVWCVVFVGTTLHTTIPFFVGNPSKLNLYLWPLLGGG